MRYVTTNIRLPEDLWKALKAEAAQRGKRFTEVVRERLSLPSPMRKTRSRSKPLFGIWKGVTIPDSLISEAKQSLFRPSDEFKAK